MDVHLTSSRARPERVPKRAAGVYTILDGERLLFVGMSGRALTGQAVIVRFLKLMFLEVSGDFIQSLTAWIPFHQK